MSIGDYLIAAPWWHWIFFVLIASLLAKWRPFTLNRNNETHEHKHVHTSKES